MMNHYMALTSTKSNKSQKGVLGFNHLENAWKGTCIVERVFHHIRVEMLWGEAVLSDFSPEDERQLLPIVYCSRRLFSAAVSYSYYWKHFKKHNRFPFPIPVSGRMLSYSFFFWILSLLLLILIKCCNF